MTDIELPERIEYGDRPLDREQLHSDPRVQFADWLSDAVERGVLEANACCLATTDPDGYPDARIVLLKGDEEGGYQFYTNYDSAKGRQLEASPRAALVFWWQSLRRQIRIRGRVRRSDPALSSAYFDSRPRDSRLGAWASPQSSPLQGREELEQRLAQLEARFPGDDPVQRPAHWGGYTLVPERFEFWQGRDSRLHDRFVYRLEGDRWTVERLAP